MFNKSIVETNPKVVNYFNNLFSKYFNGEKNIPNSVILWGSDTFAQYFFALEIARILNCKKEHLSDCDCINCRWIYNGEHPEIKIVSKINSKPAGDETKNISVRQIHEILNETTKKSQDYRVVIFCDADMEKISSSQLNHLNNFEKFKNAVNTDGDKYWVPKPLNSKILQEEASNALLKTIEETPERMLFIFLTTSPNDLISTIISRSQMFYIQNSFNKTYDLDIFKEIFSEYPNLRKENFYEFSQKSVNYIAEKEINLIEYLENMQAYFTEFLKVNHYNKALKDKTLGVIDNIIQAKKYKQSVIKDEYILDDFWINIS